jgi:hypothetical protein
MFDRLPSSDGHTSESRSSWTWSDGESPTSLQTANDTNVLINGNHSLVVRLRRDVLLVDDSAVVGEYFVIEHDDVLDQLVHLVLVLNLVFIVRDRYQSRTKANCQVVRIHHIFVGEF